MMDGTSGGRARAPGAQQRHNRQARLPTGAGVRRWVCHCQEPPVLLATLDAAGIHIKARDRYWHVVGIVRAVCPRCGTEHRLDPECAEPIGS